MYSRFFCFPVLFLASAVFFDLSRESFAQSNASSVTNTASPNAMSNTTGGSNLTYQTNNSYQNEAGFGPGFFCRTPALFISGNFQRGDADNYFSQDANQPMSFNDNNSYGGQIGIVFPFGSPVLDYCKKVARQVSRDKEISTQLSLIRACAALVKEKIAIDPKKFPLLAPCITQPGDIQVYPALPRVTRTVNSTGGDRPKTNRRPPPPKVPKVSDG